MLQGSRYVKIQVQKGMKRTSKASQSRKQNNIVPFDLITWAYLEASMFRESSSKPEWFLFFVKFCF